MVKTSTLWASIVTATLVLFALAVALVALPRASVSPPMLMPAADPEASMADVGIVNATHNLTAPWTFTLLNDTGVLRVFSVGTNTTVWGEAVQYHLSGEHVMVHYAPSNVTRGLPVARLLHPQDMGAMPDMP